ncbi:MAG: molybdopterin oxidoreductase family protein [Gammaproteobacteria bacterium]|nr:molybdopterin oxidoreductase family protein [Gammaproteobacteria bacterium]
MSATLYKNDPTGGRIEIKNTTCYMCACRCGIRVVLRDGEVRYIEGNPDHPLNKGVICAKGSSGIMKQYSPARITKPLRRKAGAERGENQFEEISWDEAFGLLEERLAKIRKTDPKKFALFTGRDQMQALTGLFAKQFGTPNYAAHGGFCSVNMAAGMIYSIGGSFWEFGGPDLERAKLFVMIGTAEDHHSNPMKMALSKFKRNGGKFISVNPVRTGYSAIADEWVPIKPGTDGALFLALTNEIIKQGLYDREFLTQYTNGAQLVNMDEASTEFGMFVRAEVPVEEGCFDPQNKLWWDRLNNKAVVTHSEDVDPRLLGSFKLDDGTPVKPSFQLLVERVKEYTPEWAEGITGIPAATIRRLAHEMGVTARDHKIELPIAWTDVWGKDHETITGNPVAFHAMRGLAAHSNGFHTIRAMSILMTILGTIDRPGGFRHKAPFPRPIPPCAKTPRGEEGINPETPLGGMPLGWPAEPDDLFVDDDGKPIRIDKAFSWEYPLSVHGLMHNVITNAWRGDPYRIDTLLIFMANMAWNSSMNTDDVRKMLNDKDDNGDFKIPFLVVCDAFQSEMVAFADLVLPDTTYLERHDVMSMLDRPISEFDGPVDSVRIPVVPPTGDCKPFQEVLIEIGSRLKLPAFVDGSGKRKYRDYPDFIINYETEPGSGIGFLAGWRGKGGEKFMMGEPNPNQWKMYEQNNCVFHYELPKSYQYMRNWNQGYLEWAQKHRLTRYAEPILPHIYSEVLQQFRLAAQGKTEGKQPPEHLRKRVENYFDPLPFYYEPLEVQLTDTRKYPLAAVTQRPMAMYHSWDSQNAWLRQIHAHNYLYMSPQLGAREGFEDGDWVWVESQWGKVRCMCRFSEAVEPGTVWTWNAIGKASGAWGLEPNANESKKGFLLNHLISEELPSTPEGEHLSNSDPVTGQAAWYDVRVRVYKAGADEPEETFPQYKTVDAVPGQEKYKKSWLGYFAGKRKGV